MATGVLVIVSWVSSRLSICLSSHVEYFSSVTMLVNLTLSGTATDHCLSSMRESYCVLYSLPIHCKKHFCRIKSTGVRPWSSHNPLYLIRITSMLSVLLVDVGFGGDAELVQAIDHAPPLYMKDPSIFNDRFPRLVRLKTNRFVVLNHIWESRLMQEEFGDRFDYNLTSIQAPWSTISIAFDLLFKSSPAVESRIHEMMVRHQGHGLLLSKQC